MARPILQIAPEVKFVRDGRGNQALKRAADKWRVLAGSRLRASQMRALLDRLEEEGDQPIYDDICEKLQIFPNEVSITIEPVLPDVQFYLKVRRRRRMAEEMFRNSAQG